MLGLGFGIWDVCGVELHRLGWAVLALNFAPEAILV